MNSVRIRIYDPQSDEDLAFGLWQRALDPVWPLTIEAFRHKTVTPEVYRTGDHLVAEVGNEIVGFVATQTRSIPGEERPRGELMLVLVDPAHRRRGIGRSLLQRADACLKERNVSRIQLASGGVGYFWAGVPIDLPDAWPFFEACGWIEKERSFDLVRELGDYTTPAWVYERLRDSGVTLRHATTEDSEAILAFEMRYFPGWWRYYKIVFEHGAHDDIVIAIAANGKVVGASFVMDFRPDWRPHGFIWQQLLGADAGGIGTLGVADEMQGKGIGLALAARVTECLQERGIAISYIGYTWLVDWYGKLGYRVWREYRMSWQDL